MRRSAAPSQLLHKRTLFTPPFAKRRCPDTHTDDVPKASALPQTVENNVKVRDGPVRSSSDILSLIKKPSTITETSCVRQCSNGVPECDTGQENAPTDSVTVLSPLRETHSNTLRSTGDANKRFPAQQLGTASRMLGGYARVGKGPQGIPGHRRSVVPAQEENQEAQAVKYYSVVWCKFSRKKHKNWEGDAVLIVKSRSVILKDTEGKEIGRRTGYKLKDLSSLEEGSTLLVGGGKEVEIQGTISAESYARGECFLGQIPVLQNIDEAQEKRSQPPKPKPFRLPTLGRPKDKNTNTAVGPLFDPTKPDALVMPSPPSQHQWKNNCGGAAVVDVVIDPHVSGQLRPHQQEGVIFLYECIMGYRHLDNYGAILADEMGLGKTLQCITLVWTLLKQGPYGGRSVVKKVLIVTPSSLTNNWSKEFSKWLGRERVNVYIVDQNNKVEQFEKQKHSEIMIISYEMFVRSSKIIEALNFDLVLCDEGHRLKNTNIKTAHLLGGLRCRRRVILTGTPVQNDLQELFALVEFVNPGVLGSSLSFRHIYEDPIIASQQPNASQTEKELGASRATQLNKITSLFILRRTQDIINRYLPPKVEFVVFCQPSETQVSVYMDLVGCRSLKKCFSNVEPGDNLSAILALRKLCNHPALLAADKDQENKSDVVQEAANLLPPHIQPGVYDEGDSGKLAVVSCILWALREPGTEKIVLVSNYTTTLDMLAALCTRYNYPYLRLDGSTPTNKRQQLVDRFNSKYSKDFVFLLSSKAGGVGLNLIGASRILLYDIDWNPATDLQAMARVWRDGQKRKVYIYRLLMTGSMDEKMYQRQVKKQGLSGAVVDARDTDRVHFSTEELKQITTYIGSDKLQGLPQVRTVFVVIQGSPMKMCEVVCINFLRSPVFYIHTGSFHNTL
ncbi:DNA repair and recombination protein RAD54B-like isoform X2 [Homarus americanus]|uniref:DNA repair and recombination protein RAD54B-like isoform X2 n=1 Tax=Homarus americanus TaxID=6706 RepID=UPI001C45329C|nr:DNA repair and recombination protein RAD54B-like isoform X2 [Homarus americanus]